MQSTAPIISDPPEVAPDTQADFARDGAICMRSVIDPNDCAAFLTECLALMEQDKDDASLAVEMGWNERIDRYWELVQPLAPIAGRLMNSRSVRFYNDHLFLKNAGKSEPTVWHQDLPFWPFSGNQITAAWIALSPVPSGGSELHYLKGSHRTGVCHRPATQAMKLPDHPDFLALALCPDYFDQADRSELCSWAMEPGDVLWHDARTIHGARANPADYPRRTGLTVRFLGDDVRWDIQPYMHAPLKGAGLSRGQSIVESSDFPLLWSCNPTAGGAA